MIKRFTISQALSHSVCVCVCVCVFLYLQALLRLATVKVNERATLPTDVEGKGNVYLGRFKGN